MYDAIFFDLDGTLVDTETIAMRSGLAAFEAIGHPVDLGFLQQLVGMDGPSSGKIIQAHRPRMELARLEAMWRQGFDEEIRQSLPLKPGATEILALAPLHMPRVLVTSSRRVDAHKKLGLAGLADAFAHVITVDDVARAKPHPEPYLLAASTLGLSPARCLVFEDSEAGAEAAHRAGCVVVQVPDVVPSQGRWAHHLAADLMSGARLAGLI
jgi:HAD superfamily hydrolase (TIGR01509 family)